MIFQNYPNPFDQETVISYQLPVISKVSLKVYDVTGRLVKTLLNEYIEAGIHQVIWDGKNKSGELVASGIYFYKITIEGNNRQLSEIKTMLLLK